MQVRVSGFEPCLLPALPPNLTQIPVIAPLAPHERQLRHKLFSTGRDRLSPAPAHGTPDARLVRDTPKTPFSGLNLVSDSTFSDLSLMIPSAGVNIFGKYRLKRLFSKMKQFKQNKTCLISGL